MNGGVHIQRDLSLGMLCVRVGGCEVCVKYEGVYMVWLLHLRV